MFPFDIPEDLTALSADEFAAFLATVRTHAQTVATDDASTSEALIATRDLYNAVTAEDTRRTETAAAASAARAELAAGLAPAPVPAPATQPATAPEPVPVPAPEPVPAVVASTIETPPVIEPVRYASLVASSDAPGAGTALATFSDVGVLLENRLSSYSSSNRTNPNAKPLGGHRFAVNGRNMTRHGGAQIRREFPAELRVTDTNNANSVIDYATSEHRLPGGSLRAAMTQSVANGAALTAAVGWCAPSETIYDLCSLETLDGILDIPEIQATRGGFFIPEDGGPNFSVIYDSIGDEGDVILTEYDVENGVEKVCVEIPCPPFVEVRMDVAYLCITGSLLQNRGYPEAVTRFTQGAMVALAHKINESVIARIVAGSGAPVVVPTIAGSDDAVSQLLSAVELAIEDMRYRNRMGRNSTIEVVLPAWVIAPMRAAMARRTGTATINVTNAEFLAAFTTRGAVPRFVYDWQDAYSGLVGGPGAQTAITVFPEEVQFLVYPAGTWVKPVRDVINLDTVYDNALLTLNQYTALFLEDGFNVMQMCVDSRLYQVELDPSGIVGCCPTA